MLKLLQKFVSVAVGFMSVPLIIFSRFSPVTIPKLQFICYLLIAFVLQGFTVFLVFWLLTIDYSLIRLEDYNHVNHIIQCIPHYVSAMGDYTYTISSPLSNPAHGPESGFFTGDTMSNDYINPFFDIFSDDTCFTFVSHLFEHISDYSNFFPLLSIILGFVLIPFQFFSGLYDIMCTYAHWGFNFNDVFDFIHMATLKDFFKNSYDGYYHLLSSIYPNKFPPLPGKTPWSSETLVFIFIQFFLLFKIISNARSLIYLTFKFLSYLILPNHLHFTIKYLFYFDKWAQTIWTPVLSLPITRKDYSKIIIGYYSIRHLVMVDLLAMMLKRIYHTGLFSCLLYIVNSGYLF